MYALSEMQVMGKGGLHAEASNTLPSDEGKQMLNQWKLRREGSQEWIEATVPGTVLTSYMNIGAIPDNRYADNMRQISESFLIQISGIRQMLPFGLLPINNSVHT